MKFATFFGRFLPLLLIAMLLAGNARAALLDVGPTVPAVIGSTPPTLGHGFPLWYRDTNRVPLELCTNTAMCLFALPNPLQPARFPDNMPDEVFFHSADTSMPTPAGTADLITGVEGNILTETDGSLTLISFARVRIRVDTNVAGTYVVTTPYKQYTFTNVPAGNRGINFTEDIGIGPNGHFAGALAGTIGPFLYCTDAPFPATDGSGGLYIGHNGTPCQVLGSTFPSAQNPSNFFRVQGPAGFGTLTTTAFTVTGKLYTAVTPTPLTVDKATYALDNTGMQVNAFATTQALSNQTNPAAPFPANFALTGALSALQLTGAGVPTQAMTTNDPADGTFFSASGLFTAPGSIPADVTVTNTADIPPVVKTVPLVDEVVIDRAAYNQSTGTLSITASSFDRVAAPVLQAFLPGVTDPLGTLSNGQLNVTFPVTDNSGPQPKTYTIPTSTITVKSAKGGSATAPVATFITSQSAPVANNDTATTTSGLPVVINVIGNDTTAASPINPASVTVTTPTGGTAAANLDGTVTYTAPAAPGIYTFFYTVADSNGTRSNVATVTVTVSAPAVASGVTAIATPSGTQTVNTPVVITASGAGGTGQYEYRFYVNDGGTFYLIQPYSSSNTCTWLPGKAGVYDFFIEVRSAGTTVLRDAFTSVFAYVVTSPAATNVYLSASSLSPQPPNSPITFTAQGVGGVGVNEYRFWLNSGSGFTVVQPYSTTNIWVWTPTVAGSYDMFVEVRKVGSAVVRDAFNEIVSYQIQ